MDSDEMAQDGQSRAKTEGESSWTYLLEGDGYGEEGWKGRSERGKRRGAKE